MTTSGTCPTARNAISPITQTVALNRARNSYVAVRDTEGPALTAPATEATCRRCGRTLPLGAFPRALRKRNGRSSWCTDCKNTATRAWRAAIRDEYNARRHVHYPPRACLWCGVEFAPKRRDSRFCRKACGEYYRANPGSHHADAAHREAHRLASSSAA